MQAIVDRRVAPLGLALVVALSGCALFDSDAPPIQKYHQTQEAYIFVVGSLLDAKMSGQISQERWDRDINPAIQEGSLLLDQMDMLIQAGEDPDRIEVIRQALIRIVARLQAQEGVV